MHFTGAHDSLAWASPDVFSPPQAEVGTKFFPGKKIVVTISPDFTDPCFVSTGIPRES